MPVESLEDLMPEEPHRPDVLIVVVIVVLLVALTVAVFLTVTEDEPPGYS